MTSDFMQLRHKTIVNEDMIKFIKNFISTNDKDKDKFKTQVAAIETETARSLQKQIKDLEQKTQEEIQSTQCSISAQLHRMTNKLAPNAEIKRVGMTGTLQNQRNSVVPVLPIGHQAP